MKISVHVPRHCEVNGKSYSGGTLLLPEPEAKALIDAGLGELLKAPEANPIFAGPTAKAEPELTVQDILRLRKDARAGKSEPKSAPNRPALKPPVKETADA